MDTEEKKLTSSEIEKMLKEAEAVHTQRRTSNKNRKKKKKIRIDMIIAAVVILAVIAGVIGLIVHFAGKSTDSASTATNDNPLIEEKYPEISDVIKNYLEAYLLEDSQERLAILAQYVDNMGDISEGDVAQRTYIDSYSDIECYTKEGPYENTYVVYAYYHMEFKNISTSAPGITRFYVIRDSNTGNVYIHNGVSGDVEKYIEDVTKDEDVQELFQEVNMELEEALASDERLKEFFDKMQTETTQETETTQAATTQQETTQAATTQQETTQTATTQPVTTTASGDN